MTDVAERIARDLEARMEAAVAQHLDERGLFLRCQGAQEVLSELHRAHLLMPDADEVVGQWLEQGGMNGLQIAGADLVPPRGG